MKPEKHKNKYLTLASTLIVPAILMITNGRVYEGGLLAIISVALVGVYAYYDDKQKGAPALPDEIDEALLRKLSENGADRIEEIVDGESTDDEGDTSK